MSAWFVYLVRCRDGSLYTGIATDVGRRIAEHEGYAGKGAKFLRGRGPLHLECVREIGARDLALRVERQIKRLPKARKEELVQHEARLDDLVDLARSRLSTS
jgi:putative endonuclease